MPLPDLLDRRSGWNAILGRRPRSQHSRRCVTQCSYIEQVHGRIEIAVEKAGRSPVQGDGDSTEARQNWRLAPALPTEEYRYSMMSTSRIGLEER